jgi:hypothetical protein
MVQIGYFRLRIFRTVMQVNYVFIALAMGHFGLCGGFDRLTFK